MLVLDHVVLRVSDLERACAFYEKVLGARVVSLDRGRMALRFGVQQLNLHGPDSTPEPVPANPPAPGGFDACFVWPGTAEEAAAHLRSRGVEPEVGPVPRTGARGPATSVYFRDPDGNLLELMSYPPPAEPPGGPDPIGRFREWLSDAFEAAIPNANAMVLATADANGAPSARYVLLKDADERGFTFYTNLESRKGAELAANPRAALVFYWAVLGRQVRVEGPVSLLERSEVERYFATRPLGSRLGAWASPQSRTIASRAELERAVAREAQRHADGAVPPPPFWGGYRVAPATIEFWTHRESRLHDRLRYTRDADGWRVERLAP
jgi:pyridoxamine 5'-phosphate oxidase